MGYFSVAQGSSGFVVDHVAHEPREIAFLDVLGKDFQSEIEVVVAEDGAARVQFVQNRHHLLSFGHRGH